MTITSNRSLSLNSPYIIKRFLPLTHNTYKSLRASADCEHCDCVWKWYIWSSLFLKWNAICLVGDKRCVRCTWQLSAVKVFDLSEKLLLKSFNTCRIRAQIAVTDMLTETVADVSSSNRTNIRFSLQAIHIEFGLFAVTLSCVTNM